MRQLFWLVLFAVIMTMAIRHFAGHKAIPPIADSGNSSSSNDALANTASIAVGTDHNVFRFQTFTLPDDPNGIGGNVSRMLIPLGWKTQGGMAYDFTCFYPAQINLRIFDPNSPALFATYPSSYFIAGDFPGFPAGSNYGGSIVASPATDFFDALKQIVIPRFRTDLANATIVETEPLPKLADMARAAAPTAPGMQTNIQAGRLRFEYTLDGKPVQEDFFAIMRVDAGPAFALWNIDQVVSVRAEKGQMDQVKQLHEVSMRSVKPDLTWYNKYFQFLTWRQQNTMAAIQSAGDFSRQIAQESDQIGDSIRQQYENQEAANDRVSEARSETMRGETPWDAGDGNKVLLPSDCGHAWQDGNGQLVVSTDSQYDPSTDPNLHSTWMPMSQLQQ